MPQIPITLPLPQPSGYSVEPTPQGIESEMEVGPSRLRRRTKTKLAVVSVVWLFTDAQYKEFRDWFYDDAVGIAGGSLWFDMPLLIGELGLTTKLARVKGGKYKATLISGIDWQVSASLEVR